VRFSHSQRAGSTQFAALGEVGLADGAAEQKLQHMFRLGPGTQVRAHVKRVYGHKTSPGCGMSAVRCCELYGVWEGGRISWGGYEKHTKQRNQLPSVLPPSRAAVSDSLYIQWDIWPTMS